ncbi:uncharacterized protein LAJ45_11380 [Morchella importuna]|uniref:uncharacterized protein n=1 Tax=Morchella importuna TaxID=1174673 RepID=UPI001E8CB417|nr:uncharacterized protein LAJ45_11380 [Morchella importuna]KAH8144612.1 hypothetical protein LAJ45_11380 [Morchella importuna]
MVQVLLLGGHGKVALHMTKLLTKAGHIVTSIIRSADHIPDINAHAVSPGLVKPTVSSIEDATPESIAVQLEGIDWVIWSAGAGGKGGPERTIAVDQEAAKKYISASLAAPSVSKFLMVSALISRREPAPYWGEEDVASFRTGWKAIPTYCEAKLQADIWLYDESRKLEKAGGKSVGWEDIHLRPGSLSDKEATGKVDLGRARAKGEVSRADVAAVGVALLERGDVAGLWVDLVEGEEEIGEAVERVVKGKITARTDAE